MSERLQKQMNEQQTQIESLKQKMLGKSQQPKETQQLKKRIPVLDEIKLDYTDSNLENQQLVNVLMIENQRLKEEIVNCTNVIQQKDVLIDDLNKQLNVYLDKNMCKEKKLSKEKKLQVIQEQTQQIQDFKLQLLELQQTNIGITKENQQLKNNAENFYQQLEKKQLNQSLQQFTDYETLQQQIQLIQQDNVKLQQQLFSKNCQIESLEFENVKCKKQADTLLKQNEQQKQHIYVDVKQIQQLNKQIIIELENQSIQIETLLSEKLLLQQELTMIKNKKYKFENVADLDYFDNFDKKDENDVQFKNIYRTKAEENNSLLLLIQNDEICQKAQKLVEKVLDLKQKQSQLCEYNTQRSIFMNNKQNSNQETIQQENTVNCVQNKNLEDNLKQQDLAKESSDTSISQNVKRVKFDNEEFYNEQNKKYCEKSQIINQEINMNKLQLENELLKTQLDVLQLKNKQNNNTQLEEEYKKLQTQYLVEKDQHNLHQKQLQDFQINEIALQQEKQLVQDKIKKIQVLQQKIKVIESQTQNSCIQANDKYSNIIQYYRTYIRQQCENGELDGVDKAVSSLFDYKIDEQQEFKINSSLLEQKQDELLGMRKSFLECQLDVINEKLIKHNIKIVINQLNQLQVQDVQIQILKYVQQDTTQQKYQIQEKTQFDEIINFQEFQQLLSQIPSQLAQ